MRGVVFTGNRQLELRDFPDPAPGPGEVVLEIKASGMCGSDLKFYRADGNETAALGLGGSGKKVIAGHEPCGVIAAVGPGVGETEGRVGQRVMNHHYTGCGRCKHCRVGWSQLCKAGITVFGATGDGAHAKYMKVPARTNVPLPDLGLTRRDVAADGGDHAAGLVSRDHRAALAAEAERRGAAPGRAGAVELEVAAAHAGRPDLEHDLVRARRGVGEVAQFQLPVAQEHDALHGAFSSLCRRGAGRRYLLSSRVIASMPSTVSGNMRPSMTACIMPIDMV